jgi:hypothetical protein
VQTAGPASAAGERKRTTAQPGHLDECPFCAGNEAVLGEVLRPLARADGPGLALGRIVVSEVQAPVLLVNPV